MTNPPLSTMAPPRLPHLPTSIKHHALLLLPPLHDRQQQILSCKSTILRFAPSPLPQAPMKFNPITAMHQLLCIIIKDEPSLVLQTANNDKQLALISESLPTGEKAFKQFFTVSTPKQNTKRCSTCASDVIYLILKH